MAEALRATPPGWRHRAWGDLATLRYGKALTEAIGNRPAVYPVYGTNGRIGLHDEALFAAGVVIGRKGAYRGVHYSDGPCWVIDTAFYLEPKVAIDPRWAYYELLQQDINRMDSGSAIPSTSREDFYHLSVLVPPLSEQRRIGAALARLDDAITFLRRLNDKLDGLCHRIFASWFIDFEPTRTSSSDASLHAGAGSRPAFPARLTEVNGRTLPEAWRIVRVSEIATTQYGYTASAQKARVGPHLLRVTDINKSNWLDWSKVPYCRVSERDRGKFLLRKGDVLVARMADPGKSAIFEDDERTAVFASYLVRLRTQTLSDAYFIYAYLKSSSFADFCRGAITGSVQPNMNARVIGSAPLVLPSEDARVAFFETIDPLRRLIVLNGKKIERLATLRNALAPELLSSRRRIFSSAE